MSDEQILATATGHSNENESSDEKDDGQEEKQVSDSVAAECFKTCLSWMERQSDVDPVQVMQLRRMMIGTAQHFCDWGAISARRRRKRPRGSGGMLPWKIFKINASRMAKNTSQYSRHSEFFYYLSG